MCKRQVTRVAKVQGEKIRRKERVKEKLEEGKKTSKRSQRDLRFHQNCTQILSNSVIWLLDTESTIVMN